MFDKVLVFVWVTVVVARPDVSHLKNVAQKATITSYDVPVSSVDNKYTTLHFQQQNVPAVGGVPSHVYGHYQTSGNVLPTLVANTGSGQYGLVNRFDGSSGGQGYYYESGGSSDSNNQGINLLAQLGQGVGQQGAHFVTQQGQGVGQQGAQFVVQQGQGGGQQFVSQQSQGLGQGVVTTQFVSQPVQHEVVHTQFVNQPVQHEVINTQFVSQPVQHEVVNTQFVSQPFQHEVVNTQFVSQPIGGSGHINVVHGGGGSGGIGHQQHYVKNEESVYYFTAPNEVKHKTHLRINVVPHHTKKTNVIYVNAPSTPEVIPEVVVPPNQVIEDKTKVVVLVKEHDQFIPVSVPAPLPVNQGKAEVFVVKYHDKQDAERILSGDGKVLSSSLLQQNKPNFVDSLSANVGSTVGPHLQTVQQVSQSSNVGTGGKVVNIKESTSFGTGYGNVYGVQSGGSNSYGTQQVVVSTTPAIDTFNLGSLNSGALTLNAGNKQVNTYEIKTVENVPAVATLGVENVGSVLSNQAVDRGSTNSAGLNIRFGEKVDGSNQAGYTIQTAEFVQNVPNSEFLGYDNIEQIKKLLGQSGQGIELVSISKGTLEGSAAGFQNQGAFFKSLGLDSESFNLASSAIPQDANTFFRNLEVSQGVNSIADLPLQSRSGESNFDGTKQIQIGNDVADVISGSALNA
ncbi:hypothetical protein FQR65_LT03589 [Abscondita terminalis]|nr:hypothetical protein FQR65_LT03589 [Abscondita terminalis]